MKYNHKQFIIKITKQINAILEIISCDLRTVYLHKLRFIQFQNDTRKTSYN